jgi:LDH2 family malate/lactate/ureidoglycolate dehydrogenase
MPRGAFAGVSEEQARGCSSLLPHSDALDVQASGIPHYYDFVGPTRDKGNVQRSKALEYIKAHHMEGVVYNMDDDNAYDPLLFDEMQKLEPKRVSVCGVLMRDRPLPGRCVRACMGEWILFYHALKGQ